MAQLDSLRAHGWSYAVGWNRDLNSYAARAWKPRPKPYRTVHGVMLALHTVSAAGESMESAAAQCAVAAAERDHGDERLSMAEQRFVAHVAGWSP